MPIDKEHIRAFRQTLVKYARDWNKIHRSYIFQGLSKNNPDVRSSCAKAQAYENVIKWLGNWFDL